MRKIAVLLFTVSALAAAAQPAAADVPATYTYSTQGSVRTYTCVTPYTGGVFGQFGAWGDYIDGCTVRLYCPSTSYTCTASEETSIATKAYRGERVTQNARLRVFNSSGTLVWWRDRSCADIDFCVNRDAVRIWGGESASVQCNGVRQHTANNTANNWCAVSMNVAG
jgi:hypothetical protein